MHNRLRRKKNSELMLKQVLDGNLALIFRNVTQRAAVPSYIARFYRAQSAERNSLPYKLHKLANSRNIEQTDRNRRTESNFALLPEVDGFLQKPPHDSLELSVLASALRRLEIDEQTCWETLVERMICRRTSDCGSVSSFLFSVALMTERDAHILSDTTKRNLEGFVQSLLETDLFINSSSSGDLTQLCYASSTLFPNIKGSRALFLKASQSLETIPRREDDPDIPLLKSCKEVCLLWSTVRMRKMKGHKIPSSFLENLVEASRGLRYCEDFNQNKVGQICESLTVLRINDPRIVYQVILFVDKHKSEINKKNLLRIVRCMHRLGVDNDILWKRLASRMEDPVGLSFSITELEEIKKCFTIYKSNQRIMGILDLFMKTKVDAQRYGGF